jgi:deoxyribodipyrimidine photo-lyase
MQASQRTEFNHTLEYAIKQSNNYKKPLIVFFGLTDEFPDANLRHYHFMLQGLKNVRNELEKRKIKFIIQRISPEKGIVKLSEDAALIIVDRGYLKIQKHWRKIVANSIKCPLIQIESDVVVPVETASNKEEFAAYTIRNKIKKRISEFLKPLNKEKVKFDSLDCDIETIDLSNISHILSKMVIDRSVKPIDGFFGGTSQAKRFLRTFLDNKIQNYASQRNDPNMDSTSDLSPYLHFGQISPVYIALETMKLKNGFEEFLEELIVRRELSMNFVYYNEFYDSIKGIHDWARKSLEKHKSDKRDYIYSKEEFEKAKTHDEYWNAAQRQMVQTGKMHGYMRMYWGKKIIEWTKTPNEAFNIALFLNNKYELDGRDPNGFTGVAWCFGNHDRAWAERPIFGKIRYMNSKGLKRKFNADAYADKY